jgi:RecQ family ATP-dependent DNA helicase
MTVHNLSENLAWLLRQSQSTCPESGHIDFPVLISTPRTNDGSTHVPQDMARLQLPPSSAPRSRLVTQQIAHTGLPTPSPTRSPAQRPRTSSNLPTPAVASRRHNAYAKESTAQVPVSSDIIDIDDIDSDEEALLSNDNPTTSSFGEWGTPKRLWEEHAATRVDPLPSKKGKKRKNCEVDDNDDIRNKRVSLSPSNDVTESSILDADIYSDSYAGPSSCRAPAEQTSASTTTSEEVYFDADDHDSPTQRPYSQRPGKSVSRSQQKPLPDEFIPDSDDDDIDEQLFDAETTHRPGNLPVFKSNMAASLATSSDSQRSGSGIAANQSSPRQRRPPGAQPVASGASPFTPGNGPVAKLTVSQKSIVAKVMAADEASLQALLRRLEGSSKTANKEYIDYMSEHGEVSTELKQRKQLASERLKATKKLIDLHAELQKILTTREEKKRQLHDLLDGGEDEDSDDETNVLNTLSRDIMKLKHVVDDKEAEIFPLLRLAGLPVEDIEPSLSSLEVQTTPAGLSRPGVLVASTQRPDPRSPSRDTVLAATPTNRKPILQTQVPRASPYDRLLEENRGSDLRSPASFSVGPNATTQQGLRHRSPSPKKPPKSNLLPTFTTNMGTPDYFEVADENFDFPEDDDADMLDAANAFEANGPWPDRPALTELNNNLRRMPTPRRGATEGPAPDPMLYDYPWSKDVAKALKKRFHLEYFRHNQLEAINATLAGDDAFVLMPTGGGKSLCYQLPSIITTGKTSGVTVVISPLLSLMQDQVDHLSRLKIQASLFNSEVTEEHRQLVMQSLKGSTPERFIQLLYITPEMLSKSTRVLNALQALHRNRKLARIVIDEAHCVSQWGHDFRPDYKELGKIRRQFSGVPVMALTATATENVKLDVMNQLDMDDSKAFTQSFNRPNLSYYVLPKPKGLLEIMAQKIQQKFSRQCGIIYCLSRKDCESVAEKLREAYGVKAAHYHAGMDSASRTDVQKKWQSNTHHVIVATIAFGMGIDKPDVRFVMHYSMPKSLEGYYQETGRAGRDGNPSSCYLYYNFTETTRIKAMIKDSDGDWEQKERQYRMLRNVVQFCENRSDCRRVQVLAYFNEHFSADQCHNKCDNCTSDATFELRDMSEHARNAVRIVEALHHAKVTMLHCIDIYRGTKSKKIRDMQHDEMEEFGLGHDLEKEDIDRLFHRLAADGVLEEYQQLNAAGFPSGYVRLGRQYLRFMKSNATLNMQIRVSPRGKTKSKPVAKAKTKKKAGTGVQAAALEDEYPASTNLSSPTVVRPSRRPQRQIVDDFDLDDDQEPFGPVRKAGARKVVPKHTIGPAIKADGILNHLDEAHRHVLNDFMETARKKVQSKHISSSLRLKTISDTMLREMGMAFPTTKEGLLKIPGMSKDLFNIYGHELLELIRAAQENYITIKSVYEDEDGEPQRELRQESYDQDVVEISDDDDFIDDDESISNNSFSENSRYFSTDGDPAVAEYNRHSWFPPTS